MTPSESERHWRLAEPAEFIPVLKGDAELLLPFPEIYGGTQSVREEAFLPEKQDTGSFEPVMEFEPAKELAKKMDTLGLEEKRSPASEEVEMEMKREQDEIALQDKLRLKRMEEEQKKQARIEKGGKEMEQWNE